MNLAFLTPFMLAGAALLAAPYLIHRIRRPEREPVRFSSLLFIPDVKKEVIERRRLQHILLMLTRMAILLVLALAFARPFAKAATVEQTDTAPSRHVLLLDTSFSMSASNRLADAQAAAEAVLNALGPEDQVAVLAFGADVEILAGFSSTTEASAGSVAAARAAVRAVSLGEESTDYAGALRAAQQMLLGEADLAEAEVRRVVHLISDLQRNGMPEPAETWKLSPSIELDAIAVGGEIPGNLAISDAIARRTLSDQIRIVAKIKNWSTDDEDIVAAKLFVAGKEIGVVEKPVRAGNATQFSFLAPAPAEGVLAGYVQLPSDAIELDNTRYFVWSPPAKHAVALISLPAAAVRDSAKPETWPSGWFLEKALPVGDEWPFSLSITQPAAFRNLLTRPGGGPSAAILSGTGGVDAAAFESIRDFAAGGGAVLALLDDASDGARQFAKSLGLEVRGFRYPEISPSRYELLTWVGLDHPVFVGFQGHLYNDFSSLRFHQYVELAEPSPDNAAVLARFESGAPAVVEVHVGEGTVMIWPFSVGLLTTNLAKSSRFVPLVYETMRHLCRVEESESALRVGGVLGGRELLFNDKGQSSVTLPGAEPRLVNAGETVRLNRAGLLTMAAGASSSVAAVNVDARESDPAVIDEAEFELKLASSPRTAEPAEAEHAGAAEETTIAREYGILLMALVVAALAFESWYMSRLTPQKRAA